MPEHAAVRTRTAPIHPRRVSGPSSRRLAPAVAVPRGHTGVFERISRIPDHFVVDRVLPIEPTEGQPRRWVVYYGPYGCSHFKGLYFDDGTTAQVSRHLESPPPTSSHP